MVRKSFFWGFSFGIVAALGLFLAAFLLNLGVPTKLTTWTGEVMAKKKVLALTSAPPRILVAGGSSALFGISARELELLTGVRSINLACHAGLGTRVLLDFAEKLARPGDVILLALEYELYNSGYFDRDSLNENNIDYVLARNPGFLTRMRTAELVWFFLMTPDKRLRRGVQGRLSGGEGRGIKKVYNADSINGWGDEILLDSDARERPRKIANNSLLASGLPGQPAGFPLLNDFLVSCARQNIRVLAAYPNLMDCPKYRTEIAHQTADRIQKFFRDHGVEMADSYDRCLKPAEDFFDTEYHLLSVPCLRRTRLLAESVRPWLVRQGLIPPQ
jgi:hypothetical protein